MIDSLLVDIVLICASIRSSESVDQFPNQATTAQYVTRHHELTRCMMLGQRSCVFMIIAFALISCLVGSLKIPRLAIQRDFRLKATEGNVYSSDETVAAMENARACAANGLSPGAGLATADEQAEVYKNKLPKLQPIRHHREQQS